MTERASPPQPQVRTREILVVDDQVDVQRVLTQFLAAHGYDVRTAGNVVQAVDVLKHAAISGVVLDVRMPGRSGLEVLEFIRRNTNLRDLPVLIFTGAQLTPEEEATIAGYRAYVFYKSEALDALVIYLDHLTGA